MWVLLRLLIALLVGVWRFFGRRTGSGEPRQTGGITWFMHQAKHKGRVISTTFGVPFDHPVTFFLSREGRLDRFFKRIGFSQEIQAGAPDFDEQVYVSCDHPALEPILQANRDIRVAILALFRRGATRIRADGKHLWVEVPKNNPPDEATLAELVVVRDALNAVPRHHLRMLRDPFFWRVLAVESVAWSLALYGVPAIIEIATRSHPQYFDLAPVFKIGIPTAILVFALLIAAARWVLRGSSRAHRVLTESAILLIIGVPLSSIQMVSDANIALDRSAPSMVEQRVVDKYTRITRGSKGRKRTHYHLKLAPSGPETLPVPADIEVSPAIYNRVRPTGAIAIKMRAGALRIPWVEEIRAVR